LRRQQTLRRAPDERWLTGEKLVRQDPERVHVGAVIDGGIGARLLGRHVSRRAERDAH